MKKKILKSKGRMVAAGIVTAVLLVLSVLAVQGNGLQMGNLVLALFLSFLAGILLLADFEVGEDHKPGMVCGTSGISAVQH